jgi:hypothetical protein
MAPLRLTLPHPDVAAGDRIIGDARSGAVSTGTGKGEDSKVFHLALQFRILLEKKIGPCSGHTQPFSFSSKFKIALHSDLGLPVPDSVAWAPPQKLERGQEIELPDQQRC